MIFEVEVYFDKAATAAQTMGAMIGSFLNYQLYYDQFKLEKDELNFRGCFCTAPQIKNTPRNLFSEAYGTFFLVFVIFYIAKPELQIEGVEKLQYGIGSLDALPVGILVWAIGMSLRLYVMHVHLRCIHLDHPSWHLSETLKSPICCILGTDVLHACLPFLSRQMCEVLLEGLRPHTQVRGMKANPDDYQQNIISN